MKSIFKKTAFFIPILFLIFSCGDGDSSDLGSDSVIQGSTNKFAVTGDYLYILNESSLIPYNLSNPESPQKESEVFLGVGIETVITRGDNLFIGAQDGMYIFDISDRANPKQLSVYRHMTACDPVALKDSVAYVTLRTNNITCGGNINVLEVLDIRNLNNPTRRNSINMREPHGLSVEGNNLFVAEEDFGIVNFDVEEAYSPTMKEEIKPLHNSKDVIAVDNANFEKLLIVTGADGIFQYTYKDGSFQLLSEFKFI
ncbi:MAG: hypothetical protein ACI85I_000536 [Arenicella sp.]|jgi:hypothetical protein